MHLTFKSYSKGRIERHLSVEIVEVRRVMEAVW
jgi:hypothetical protein